jgi:hypothetical protein
VNGTTVLRSYTEFTRRAARESRDGEFLVVA